MPELTPPAGYQNYHVIIVPSMPAAVLATYTPGYMELCADDDTKELVVGDGATVGGAYRIAAGGAAGGNTWYNIHVEGASPTTDLVPTAGNSELTVSGLYGFVFQTDGATKKLIGALPIPGPVGEGLISTGSGWVSGLPSVSILGRQPPFIAEPGDYYTNQVLQVLGFNYINAPVVTPPTDGQALIYSNAASGYVGGTVGGPGGGGPTPINLLENPVLDVTNPPSWVFFNGVRALSFSNSTSQLFYGVMRWPDASSFAVKLICSMPSVTTGTLGWGFQMMKVSPGAATSIKADNYATENLGSATVSGTANGPFEVDISVTNIGSAVAGDYIRWKLRRNTSVGGNAAGLAELSIAQFIPTA